MVRDKSAARGSWQGNTGGGMEKGQGEAAFQSQSTTTAQQKQAPLGDLPAYVKGNLIFVGGRHLCSLPDGQLRRTFDAARELLRGGLSFRTDLLALAERHGAREIVCRERLSGRTYRISLREFRAKGWAYRSTQFGDQWACDLRYWTADPEPGQPEQLGLWAVGHER